MKRILSVILIFTVVSTFMFGCAKPAPAPTPAPAPAPTPAPAPAPSPQVSTSGPSTFKLKFTTNFGEKHDLSVASKLFMDEVTKRTDGQVTFRSYFGGALGGAKEVLHYAKDGIVDFCSFLPAYYPGEFNLAQVTGVPYTGYETDARQKTIIQLLEEIPELEEEFSAVNVKVLFPATANANALVAKERIDTVDDLKGLKIRGAGYELVAMEYWGATPVAISFGEISDSLSRGVIDAALGMPPQTFVTIGAHETCEYFVDPGYGSTGCLYSVMNLDSYNDLPPDIRKVFDEVGEMVAGKYMDIRMAGIRKAIPKILAAGGEIYALSDETQTQLEALAKEATFERWVSDRVEDGASEDLARKTLARFMELVEEYRPESTFKEMVEMYETEFK